jgi:EAL domain-containing protein (putative c-di-GMP-specific phosphodiesterase class I)
VLVDDAGGGFPLAGPLRLRRSSAGFAIAGRRVGVIVVASVTSIPPSDGWTINSVIDTQAIRTLFQPVVHLDSGSVVGFEALSRGPAGSSLESPVSLLDAARKAGRLGELDWLCRVHAMRAASASGLHADLSWFINVEPDGLAIACPGHLRDSLANASAGLRVVLEVVERHEEGHVSNLLRATDRARADSWGVALDDVGTDDASLALLLLLQPDVIKLDLSLVRGAAHRAVAQVTAAVRSYAERTGAVILAEGIETEEHERLALVFGATYGQGYRYGAPQPLPAVVSPPRHVVPLRQRPQPVGGLTAFDVVSAKISPQRAVKKDLLHIAQHLEEMALTEGDPCVLLAGFQDASAFAPEKRWRYMDLAARNALTVVLADQLTRYVDHRLYIGPLPAGSPVAKEWTVIVMGPHQTAAFIARDCGVGQGSDRQFDFVYTHDWALVSAAGRAFLQELEAGSLLLGDGEPQVGSRPRTG